MVDDQSLQENGIKEMEAHHSKIEHRSTRLVLRQDRIQSAPRYKYSYRTNDQSTIIHPNLMQIKSIHSEVPQSRINGSQDVSSHKSPYKIMEKADNCKGFRSGNQTISHERKGFQS